VSGIARDGEDGPLGDDPASAVALRLRFAPGQASTYRVTTESYKSVTWKGDPSAKPDWFRDGRSGSRLAMTLQQRVVDVTDSDVADCEVTILSLRYVSERPRETMIEFDSDAAADPNHPMTGLIGARYRIGMSSKGEVLTVAGLETIGNAVRGTSPAGVAAARLMEADEVRKRHRIVPLTLLGDSLVEEGETWRDGREFSFGELGRKAYERVHTLISADAGGQGVAVVEMRGIPPAGPAGADAMRHPMMMDSVDE
jgi:hypothetical protein